MASPSGKPLGYQKGPWFQPFGRIMNELPHKQLVFKTYSGQHFLNAMMYYPLSRLGFLRCRKCSFCARSRVHATCADYLAHLAHTLAPTNLRLNIFWNSLASDHPSRFRCSRQSDPRHGVSARNKPHNEHDEWTYSPRHGNHRMVSTHRGSVRLLLLRSLTNTVKYNAKDIREIQSNILDSSDFLNKDDF